MGIFKAYDIRGLVPSQLDERLALKIGRAFGAFLGRGPMGVGRDMRASSSDLSGGLIEGLRDHGIDVVDLGLCSTPMLNYAVASGTFTGGVQVTASHNPGCYNGFKLCREQGIPLSGDTGIGWMETWIRNEEASFRPAPARGLLGHADPRPAYREFLLSQTDPGPRKLAVVADTGNGMVGYHEFGVLAELFPGTIGMYLEPDGTFPHHEANPLVERNLDDLRHRVVTERADIGLAFDGDGDRVVFVDETGRTVMADLALAILAASMLREAPGSTILYDLRSSRAVKEAIESAGGRPMLSRVGHAFIKRTLREHAGLLGGELSGHFYFRSFHYLDSGILGALKILELLSRTDQSFSTLVTPLDRYPRTGEVNYEVEDPDAILDTIERTFRDEGEIHHLDGLSFETDVYWFNIRKSNTEPLVRLNLQAIDGGVLASARKRLEDLLGEPVDH